VRLIPKSAPPRFSADSSSNGAEMAAAVAVFLVVGLLLDSWLGTSPWFTLALTLFAAVGQFVKMWFTYSARMNGLEDERSRMASGRRM